MGVFQGKDVIPRNDRRATWHDYQGRALYMLTFRKNGPVEDFCAITDNPVRGQRLNPQIRLSESGEALTRAILRFGHKNPALQVLRYMVMPDHLHLLLFVRERLKEPFGSMVARFKGGCSREYWATLPEEEQAARIPVFARNYHDRIVTRRGQLQALIDYIRDNPRRYLLKKLLPEMFVRKNRLVINGKAYMAFGNPLLLREPEKEMVLVRSHFTPEEVEALKERWRRCSRNGGVLVSPFISPRERVVMRETLESGGKIIEILDNGFPERFKPAGKAFDYCANGQLLYIAPAEYSSRRIRMTRALAWRLNALAAEVCALDAYSLLSLNPQPRQ